MSRRYDTRESELDIRNDYEDKDPHKYDQFLKDEKGDNKVTGLDIENTMNKLNEDRYYNTTARMGLKKSPKPYSSFYILNYFAKFFVYLKNYIKYGYFGEL